MDTDMKHRKQNGVNTWDLKMKGHRVPGRGQAEVSHYSASILRCH